MIEPPPTTPNPGEALPPPGDCSPEDCPIVALQVASLRGRPRRRTVLQGILAGLGAILWPRWAFAKKVAVKLDKLPALKKVGGWTVVKIKGERILIFRETADVVRAVSAICTHKKTLLSYSPSRRMIICKKHGSRFSLSGKVLKGPAKKPLTRFFKAKLDLEKNRIILKL